MDRRIKRTRRLLGEALVDLLQERDLRDITIRDITERADVAYSTFFRNFDSVEDLLLAHLRDFVTALAEQVQVDAHAPYPVRARTTILTLFQLFHDNPKLPRVLFQTPAAQPVLKAFKAEQMQPNVQLARTQGAGDQPPVELVIHNVIVQMFGMIDWWLEHDMQPAPAVMADYYEQIVLRPMWTLLLGPAGMDALFAEGIDTGQT